ncbi:MAG: DM13 domain-containing protein [Actinomycetota bacterium]|nr:DM13 domain-containing protein [Actinomycetota bacterium]
MRRTVVTMLAAGLLVGSLGAPATAKTVTKSWSGLVPTPLPLLAENGGCVGEGSTEDVHKDTYTFKTPKHRKTGTLAVKISGFSGDLDLHVYKGTSVIGSSTSDNLSQDYEAVTVGRLKGGTTINIVTCNWSGSPEYKGSLSYKHR